MSTLIDRTRAILLSPRTEWAVIAAEPQSVAGLYRSHLAWLAAIPAAAGFVGFSLVGFGAFGVSVRLPVAAGLVHAVLGFASTLGAVYVLACIARVLAPRFGGQPDALAAFKLVVYASTAALLAGVVYVLPALSVLALIGALYSAWLLYVGAPVLMKCPQHRAAGYTAVLLACGLVTSWVLSAALALVAGPAALPGMAVSVSRPTPHEAASIDPGKPDAPGRRLEAATRRAEQASERGDAAGAAQAAAAEEVAAIGGGQARATPLDAQRLRAYLPPAIGDLPRESIEQQDIGALLGIPGGASAQGTYRRGSREVRLTISDAGSLLNLMGLAAWASAGYERHDRQGSERAYRQGARSVREMAHADGTSAEYAVLLENGVMVEAEGDQVELDVLKRAVHSLNLVELGARR